MADATIAPLPGTDPKLIARFMAKVQITDGCWLWSGARTGARYGELRVDGRPATTHRLSWTLFVGPIPDGLCVCHHCDTPPCVNPAHLFLGSKADNNADKCRKGRRRGGGGYGDRNGRRTHPESTVRGERQHAAKLTAETVREIRDACASGEAQWVVGERYGVSQAAVWAVVRRKTWAHVK